MKKIIDFVKLKVHIIQISFFIHPRTPNTY